MSRKAIRTDPRTVDLDLSEPMDDRALVGRHVARVEVQREQMLIELAEMEGVGRQGTLHVPWQKTIGKRRREILLPEGMPPPALRFLRLHSKLVNLIPSRGRPFIEHQLEIVDFYVSLQCAARARADVQLIHPAELVAAFPDQRVAARIHSRCASR